MKMDREEVEYIFGKNAAREVLNERPDIVVEAHVVADFSDEQILSLLDKKHVTLKLFNEKNPPRGVSAKAAHQGIVIGILPAKLMVTYKTFKQTLKNDPNTALLVLGEVPRTFDYIALIAIVAAVSLVLKPSK